MKKIIMIVTCILCLVSCQNEDNDGKNLILEEGTYSQVQVADEDFPARIWIEDGKMSFSYDFLSAYFTSGTYSQDNNLVTLITDDKKYTYVFELTEEGLVFLQDQSSKIRYTDERLQVIIKDQTLFVKED